MEQETYHIGQKRIVLRNDYPFAILTVGVTNNSDTKYVSKTVSYTVRRDGGSTYTSDESNFFVLLGIRGMQSLIKQIIETGRVKHPSWSVYDILKAHYDAQTFKQKIKE